jgi:hypothetical protein
MSMKWTLSLQQAVQTFKIVKYRRSHTFYTVDPQMPLRLSALRAGSALHQRGLLVLISVRTGVKSKVTVRLEGLGKF